MNPQCQGSIHIIGQHLGCGANIGQNRVFDLSKLVLLHETDLDFVLKAD